MLSKLTKREKEILSLLSSGLSNIGISQRLVISLCTVKCHLRNIYNKIGLLPADKKVDTRVLATNWYIANKGK